MAQDAVVPGSRSSIDWTGLLAPAALLALAVAVLWKAVASPPYVAVVSALSSAVALLAALAWIQGTDVDPFAGPLAVKIGILAVVILFQPSLVGRDPQFELAVTERLVAQGTWEPGLGLASHKAQGYSHYPGLSFVTSSLVLLSGVEPSALARLLPPLFSLASLVLVVAIAREVLGDDQRAAWIGLAWACFWMANVFRAEFVHESLAFPFFLGGVWLIFRQSTSRSLAPAALFILVVAALVVTHHLTTMFLLVFLLLFGLARFLLDTAGQEAGSPRVYVPALGFLGLAVAYNAVFGEAGSLGVFESLQETLTSYLDGLGSEPSDVGTQPPAGDGGPADGGSGPEPPPAPTETNPQVKQAVFYERVGRDAVLFDGRIAFSLVLLLLSVGNLAWRSLERRLDLRWTSLLAWTMFVFTVGFVVYVLNVTVGLDAPRLLPWAFVFLLITATDVPGRGSVTQRIRERIEDAMPDANVQLAIVAALLVAFAGFQLVTLPPYLVTDDEDPAYYRGQVRMTYHESEQAMGDWVNDELDDGTRIIGDQTSRELVGPTDHGEASAIAAEVYAGERFPHRDVYLTWREEMREAYLGNDGSMQTTFFPVDDAVERTFDGSPHFAKLYANPRTGVYAYEA